MIPTVYSRVYAVTHAGLLWATWCGFSFFSHADFIYFRGWAGDPPLDPTALPWDGSQGEDPEDDLP